MRTPTRDGRSGQALVELIICLVALLALVAGLLEVTSLTRIHTDRMVDARKSAGLGSFSSSEPTSDGISSYIRSLEPGADQRRHTQDDDIAEYADEDDLNTRFVDRAVQTGDDWETLRQGIDGSQLWGLHEQPAFLVSYFGLFQRASSTSVDLDTPDYRLIRALLYRPDDDRIEIRSEVWMTWTKGLL